jgi:hypothetical protein
VPDMTMAPQAASATETATEKYARQTRNGVVFIAWVVGIIAVISLILGIIAGVQLSKIANYDSNNATTNSDCQTLGTC